jgi:archaetidylinositol phosphate synthase
MPLAKRLSWMDPDTMTWLAMLFAVVTGVAVWAAGEWGHHLLLLALLAIVLNSLLDALDGLVARLTDKASPRGDFLDHVVDRYADAFIIGGILLSAYCHVTVGVLALLGVIFTSYMGTQAMALGVGRDYGGILGRADRLVLLILAFLVQWGWVVGTGHAHILTLDIRGIDYQVTVLEALMVWFAIAGHVTALQRATGTWRDLSGRPQEKGPKTEESEEVAIEVTISQGDDETKDDGDESPSASAKHTSEEEDDEGTDTSAEEG